MVTPERMRSALNRIIDAHRLAAVECYDRIRPLIDEGAPYVGGVVEVGDEIVWPDDLVAMLIWFHHAEIKAALDAIFERAITAIKAKAEGEGVAI